MLTIYRKTEKGYNEIKTRADRLSQRLRATLILVDGKTTDARLDQMVAGGTDDVLQTLLDMAYIEVVAVLE